MEIKEINLKREKQFDIDTDEDSVLLQQCINTSIKIMKQYESHRSDLVSRSYHDNISRLFNTSVKLLFEAKKYNRSKGNNDVNRN